MADPGFPVGGGGGGANLRRIHFSAKMYAKTKEIDPVGGGRPPLDPPMTGNTFPIYTTKNSTTLVAIFVGLKFTYTYFKH